MDLLWKYSLNHLPCLPLQILEIGPAGLHMGMTDLRTVTLCGMFHWLKLQKATGLYNAINVLAIDLYAMFRAAAVS